MNKSVLKTYLLSSFSDSMKEDTYKMLKEEINKLAEQNEDDDAKWLAMEIKNNYPQFEIMQKYFVRGKLDSIDSNLKHIHRILRHRIDDKRIIRIDSNLNILTIIVVIYSILSVIGAIILIIG